MASLTGTTAIIMIAVPGLFDAPQQLQGFAADDVFDNETLDSAEVSMGVDGKLSAGFVFVPIRQGYSLQANSPSIDVFDRWWTTQQSLLDILDATGIIQIPAISKKWSMTGGKLTGYKPLPDIKKLLAPQKFAITWERAFPSPI